MGAPGERQPIDFPGFSSLFCDEILRAELPGYDRHKSSPWRALRRKAHTTSAGRRATTRDPRPAKARGAPEGFSTVERSGPQGGARHRARPAAADAAEEIALYEDEANLDRWSISKRTARLLYEAAHLRERQLGNAREARKTYTQSLTTDPTLQATTWALFGLFGARGAWENLVRLLDAEIRFAPLPNPSDRADVLVEKGRVLEDRLGTRGRGPRGLPDGARPRPDPPGGLAGAAAGGPAGGRRRRRRGGAARAGCPRRRAPGARPVRGRAGHQRARLAGPQAATPAGTQKVRQGVEDLLRLSLPPSAEEPVGAELYRLSLVADDPDLRTRVLDFLDSRINRGEAPAPAGAGLARVALPGKGPPAAAAGRGDAALAVLERGLRARARPSAADRRPARRGGEGRAGRRHHTVARGAAHPDRQPPAGTRRCCVARKPSPGPGRWARRSAAWTAVARQPAGAAGLAGARAGGGPVGRRRGSGAPVRGPGRADGGPEQRRLRAWRPTHGPASRPGRRPTCWSGRRSSSSRFSRTPVRPASLPCARSAWCRTTRPPARCCGACSPSCASGQRWPTCWRPTRQRRPATRASRSCSRCCWCSTATSCATRARPAASSRRAPPPATRSWPPPAAADQAGDRYISTGEGAEEAIRQLRSLSERIERRRSGRRRPGCGCSPPGWPGTPARSGRPWRWPRRPSAAPPAPPRPPSWSGCIGSTDRTEDRLKVLASELQTSEQTGRSADVVRALRFRLALLRGRGRPTRGGAGHLAAAARAEGPQRRALVLGDRPGLAARSRSRRRCSKKPAVVAVFAEAGRGERRLAAAVAGRGPRGRRIRRPRRAEAYRGRSRRRPPACWPSRRRWGCCA